MASIGGERGGAVRHAQRATGQTRALATMIASERPFPEIAQQLVAVRGSLDSLLVRPIALQLGACVPNPRARNEIDGLLRAALGRNGHGRLPGGARGRAPLARPTTIPALEGSSSP